MHAGRTQPNRDASQHGFDHLLPRVDRDRATARVVDRGIEAATAL